MSSSSPSSGSGRSRAASSTVPSAVTPSDTSRDITSPAAAKASVLAARKRVRAGAASSELAIVRWRHSPLMPTTASTRMNSALVSDM